MAIDYLKTKFRGKSKYDIVDKRNYDMVQRNLIASKNSFSILTTSSSKEITIKGVPYGVCLWDNHMIETIKDREINGGYITNKIFRESMIEITKDIYSNIINILRTKDIPLIERTYKYPEGQIDFMKWCDILRNSKFLMMDIDRQYWYTAHMLGYVSDKVFNKYFYDDDWKEVCNIAIGKLASSKEARFYVDGNELQINVGNKLMPYIIRSNIPTPDEGQYTLLQKVRQNIVNYSKNIIDDLADHFRDEIYGCGNTDNMYFPNDHALMSRINKYVKSLGYECKFEYVWKHSDTEIRAQEDKITPEGDAIWRYPIRIQLFNTLVNKNPVLVKSDF